MVAYLVDAGWVSLAALGLMFVFLLFALRLSRRNSRYLTSNATHVEEALALQRRTVDLLEAILEEHRRGRAS
ncbi:hypothetical protein [Falsiroseomonas sp. HW251]|uniref:hypothetical protein n=1 Tax=Falsiroseomonas sp. HW251 TaxID=3390998 RepID=UPI003D321682